uniref:Ion_trans domain-containing protein n=1 Tax=Macrostomum lignano TaxID=282301 RepID=A0A1I8FDV5_9PLAT
PQTLTDIIEYSNVFFCGVFALEMRCSNCWGDGLIDYVSSGFNVFDASIVILSAVRASARSAGGYRSLLRKQSFGPLLEIKVRFLPALRQQLFVMLKTMDNVATFFALLVAVYLHI